MDERDLRNLTRARAIIGRWAAFYNTERRHASFNYLPPAEYWAGEPEARIEGRKKKLEGARKRRETINRQRPQEAA